MFDPPTNERTIVEPSVVHDAEDDEEGRLMALVDELAVLAADLWFAQKLAPPAIEEEKEVLVWFARTECPGGARSNFGQRHG
jgi:hypothetical protein